MIYVVIIPYFYHNVNDYPPLFRKKPQKVAFTNRSRLDNKKKN